MDTLTYAVETNTHRIVEYKHIGKRVRLVVYGISFSDTWLEWCHPKLAQARFEKLVEMNSKLIVDKSKLTFKSPETILHEKRKTSAMRDDWEEWQGGSFDLLDFY